MAPSLLLCLGAQSSLWGHNSRLGEHKQWFGGARPRHSPPLAPGLGHKTRSQCQGHKKKSETNDKDSSSKDRPSRGHIQGCSRPRTKDTGASILKKRRSSKFFFRRSPKQEKRSLQIFREISGVFQQNFDDSK